MDVKSIPAKLKTFFKNYRYVLLILVIGLVLMLLPETKSKTESETDNSSEQQETVETAEEKLCAILRSIQGVGQTQVLLTVVNDGETLYQTDTDASSSDTAQDSREQTVIITDADRNQSGLIKVHKAPVYRGAVVVCEGGDQPAVQLAVTEAVMRATGLRADQICVLKMK